MIESVLWIVRMAWRDSRRSRRRLLLFSSPLLFGVAALVAIQALRDNVNEAIGEQSRVLLGADFLVSTNRPFEADAETFVRGFGGEQAREIALTTMATNLVTGATRMVQLRAVSPAFPFYGTIETSPPGVWTRGLAAGEAVVEPAVMEQLGLRIGDVIRMGKTEATVVGVIENAPPRASFFAAFAPQVFTRYEEAERSGLLGVRSLAFYRLYLKLAKELSESELTEAVKDDMKAMRLSYDTPEKRRRGIERQLNRLYRFLSLIGIASVILGGIGIASAIHQHVSGRLASIAILRCLGCTARQAFGVYVLQAIVLGLVGCIGGTMLGVAIQYGVTLGVSKLTPLTIPFHLSWPAIGLGFGLSMGICLGFSLLPLLKIRRVPPLAAIRSALLSTAGLKRWDPGRLVILVAMFAMLVSFSFWQSNDKMAALRLSGGVLGVFFALLAVARLVVWISRKAIRSWWPFPVRQGMANLYRPHNQTTAFLLALGLGVFLILTLVLVQRLLVNELKNDRLSSKGNLFLVDVQLDQRDAVAQTLADEGVVIVEKAPMISMRIDGINGRSIRELIDDPKLRIPGWTVRREFRCTYRDHLTDSEKLMKGEWVGRVENPDLDAPIPVSLEEGIAKDLKVSIGDELTMDVQGVPLTLEVASIREVDWGSLGLNFFIVFPEGVLDESLSFYVYTTTVGDAASSARVQSALAKVAPNVSVIDLLQVVAMLESILNQVVLAIQFMAMFTVVTGLLILVSTLVSGKAERLREMALLRTLGASNRQILQVMASEYTLLGFLAATSGAALSLAVLGPLAKRHLETAFALDFGPVFWTIGLSSLATLVLGLTLSGGVVNRAPLEVLRGQEAS